MAKEFNVPPVVFPSSGNPATPASGPQQRRSPPPLSSHRDPQALASPSCPSISTPPLPPLPSPLPHSSPPQLVAADSTTSPLSSKNSASTPRKSTKKPYRCLVIIGHFRFSCT